MAAAGRATTVGLHPVGEVVVDPEEVERLPDGLEIAVSDLGHRRPERLEDCRGVAAREQRLGEHAVVEGVVALGGGGVGRAVGRGIDRLGVEHDADRHAGCGPADRQGAEAVGEVEVVNGRQGGAKVPLARRVDAEEMAENRRAPRLVQRHEALHPVAEAPGHHVGVVGEGVGGVACAPAAVAVLLDRQIPMVERRKGLDLLCEQRVDQPIVEGEPLLVDRAAPVGDHPRPGDGEAIGVDPQRADQPHVVLEAVIVVAGDVPGVAVHDPPRDPRERVPDRGLASVLIMRALDLVGGGRHAEEEVGREAASERVVGHG